MEVSIPGVMGAGIGLALGNCGLQVVAGVVEARLRKLDRSSGPAEKAVLRARSHHAVVLFAIVTVGVFPVIGYLLGVTMSGG